MLRLICIKPSVYQEPHNVNSFPYHFISQLNEESPLQTTHSRVVQKQHFYAHMYIRQMWYIVSQSSNSTKVPNSTEEWQVHVTLWIRIVQSIFTLNTQLHCILNELFVSNSTNSHAIRTNCSYSCMYMSTCGLLHKSLVFHVYDVGNSLQLSLKRLSSPFADAILNATNTCHTSARGIPHVSIDSSLKVNMTYTYLERE